MSTALDVVHSVPLIRYDEMCRAIEAAYSIDEVKEIHSRALAMEAYFRQAKNRENEIKAERIRDRAERRAGQLLNETPKATGAPGPGRGKAGTEAGPAFTQAKTLANLGVSKKQSAKWQAVAALPDDQFEGALNSPKPTVAINAIVKRKRRAVRELALAERTRRAATQLGSKLYGVIYADPPWRFKPYAEETGSDRAADNHYPTLTIDDIADIEPPAAPDCALFLWVTIPMLELGIKLLQRWGFAYKSACVWAKPQIGTGYWFRNQVELLLVGTRGNVPAPASGDQPPQIQTLDRGKHSAKPDAFAVMIEALYPNVPKLEMFARTERIGWDVWGNEAS